MPSITPAPAQVAAAPVAAAKERSPSVTPPRAPSITQARSPTVVVAVAEMVPLPERKASVVVPTVAAAATVAAVAVAATTDAPQLYFCGGANKSSRAADVLRMLHRDLDESGVRGWLEFGAAHASPGSRAAQQSCRAFVCVTSNAADADAAMCLQLAEALRGAQPVYAVDGLADVDAFASRLHAHAATRVPGATDSGAALASRLVAVPWAAPHMRCATLAAAAGLAYAPAPVLSEHPAAHAILVVSAKKAREQGLRAALLVQAMGISAHALAEGEDAQRMDNAAVLIVASPGCMDDDDFVDALHDARSGPVAVLGDATEIVSRARACKLPKLLAVEAYNEDSFNDMLAALCGPSPVALPGAPFSLFEPAVVKSRYADDGLRDWFFAKLGGAGKAVVLEAPPGWGKSVLLATLCRMSNAIVHGLARESRPLRGEVPVAALHFFSVNDQRSQSIELCVRSIVRQLCAAVPGFREQIPESAEDVDALITQSSASPSALIDALIVQPAVALKNHPARVFVVLDGIDECHNPVGLEEAVAQKWAHAPAWLVLVASRRMVIGSNGLGFRLVTSLDAKHDLDVVVERRFAHWGVRAAPDLLVGLISNPEAGSGLWLAALDEALCRRANALSAGAELAALQPESDSPAHALFAALEEAMGDAKAFEMLVKRCILLPRAPVPLALAGALLPGVDVAAVASFVVAGDDIATHTSLRRLALERFTVGSADHLELAKALEAVVDAIAAPDWLPSSALSPREAFAVLHCGYHYMQAGDFAGAKTWFTFPRLYRLVAEHVAQYRTLGNMIAEARQMQCDLLADVLRLAKSALMFDPRELAGQVLGRVRVVNAAGGELVKGARAWVDDAIKKGKLVVAVPNRYFSGLEAAGSALRGIIGLPGPVQSMQMSGKGDVVVVACEGDKHATLWDVARAAELRRFVNKPNDVVAVAIHESGVVAVASNDRSVTVFETASGRVTQTLQAKYDITCVAINARWVLAGGGKQVDVWKVADPSTRFTLEGHTAEVRAVSVGTSMCVTGSSDKTGKVFSLKTGKEVCVLDGHSRDVRAVAINEDDDRIVTGSWDRNGLLWDLNSSLPTELADLEGHTQRINSVAVSDDGGVIVTGAYDGTARVWNGSGELVRVLHGHRGDVWCVSVTRDGHKAATASLDRTVRLWDLTGPVEDSLPTGHEDEVRCVAVSGARCLSGSSDCTAVLWNLSNGQALRTLEGHEEAVTCVSMSADGNKALTGSEDQTVRYWDLAGNKGTELAVLEGHAHALESVAFTIDGARAKTMTLEREQFLWDLAKAEQITSSADYGWTATTTQAPVPQRVDGSHVPGPSLSSVGFTLEATGFVVALQTSEGQPPVAYSEMGMGFYVWTFEGE